MRRMLIFFLTLGWQIAYAQNGFQKLKDDFLHPSSATRPGCYWYWINDNISKSGITKDLEAMSRVGIGRAFIGHFYDRRSDSDTKPGNVKFMSPEWWEALQWAVKEAGRLNIDIGFFNAPGWSQSGGPWINTAQSMRFLGNSEMSLAGGRLIDTLVPVPIIETYPNTRAARIKTGPNFTAKDFQDVRLVAYKQPLAETQPVQINSYSGEIAGVKDLFDGDDSSFVSFPANKEQVIKIHLGKNQGNWPWIQNVIIKPLDHSYLLRCSVESSTDDLHYRELTTYSEERGHQGSKKLDQIVIPFKAESAEYFRIKIQFKGLSAAVKTVRVSEISLSGTGLLAGYVRKQLGETSPQTKIPWDDYIWKPQAGVEKNSAIQSEQVIDLSDKLDKSGKLVWKAPPGNWKIMRFGLIPTGTQCNPCSPESLGLEVDKMNKEHVTSLFEGMVGEFLRRTPKEDRQALKYVIADSYETGPQNWTDGFIEKFQKRYGYSPVKFLPALTGHVVDNTEVSNRFLWDIRRLVVESVANDYAGGLKEICNKNGLKLWLENYGHWGFISEFLLYGSKTDEVAGEFWESWDPITNIECRAAASSAHTYGKNTVYAEAFTATRSFQPTPASLKRWADWAFGAGINHMVLHVYIHQPEENPPGIIEWFGTAFNRHNTWFEQSKAFIDYLRRCSVLLKTGSPVADIAYYIGENSPSMEGPKVPALPAGYDFDFINSDVLINYASVKNGRIVIKNGPSYGVLVLPPSTEMRPEVAKAIMKLVEQGAVVLGAKPLSSPSLEDYPSSDRKLQQTVKQAWEGIDSLKNKSQKHGSGWVYNYTPLEDVLKLQNIARDIELVGDTSKFGVAGDNRIGVNGTGGIIFKHRQESDHDVYFLSNTSNQTKDITVSFRQSQKKPVMFNAVTTEISDVLNFSYKEGRTIIPLHLEGSESVFIVFSDVPVSEKHVEKPVFNNLLSLDDNWKVKFHGQGAPDETSFNQLTDWTNNRNSAIKYYSGTADYEKSFTLPQLSGRKILLDLGKVSSIATITLNDKLVGTLWTNPWAIDITPFVVPGSNRLKISVTNTWNNRLVGNKIDKAGPAYGYVSQPYVYDAKNPMMPSGLIGPLWIKQETR